MAVHANVEANTAQRLVQIELQHVAMLSSQLRSLQAKLHLLRENARGVLGMSGLASVELDGLRTQYEHLGTDVSNFHDAWDAGRAALVTATKNAVQDRRIVSCPAPPMSADSDTIGGDDALSEPTQGVIRDDTSESGEEAEILEAIAMPRQRSTLNRHQRIERMQLDREAEKLRREKRDADVHLLKELKSVIRLRPQSYSGRPSREWSAQLADAANS